MSDFSIAEWGPCSCETIKRKGIAVPHWRSLVPSKYVSHYDLKGRDCTVTIKAIKLADIVGSGGKKSQKALVTFNEAEKGMVMGATCLKTIAGMYGDDYDTWVGKRITIYPTTTEASGETVGTIRVRPQKPAEKKAEEKAREPGQEG